MAEYYLMSQLPSLDGIDDSSPLPITEDRFLELCGRLLDEKALCEVKNLTLIPKRFAEPSVSPLVNAWNEGERDLRRALEKVRADKMNKPLDTGTGFLSFELIKTAGTAAEIQNPLEAERFLSRYRLEFLETLRPTNPFTEDFVFYYALRLKLLLRARQFDQTLGEAAYKNIYNSILNGDRLEAEQ